MTHEILLGESMGILKWLRSPVTPPEFDHSVGLLAGLFCLVVIGIPGIIDGHVRVGILFTFVGAVSVIHAWRFWRGKRSRHPTQLDRKADTPP